MTRVSPEVVKMQLDRTVGTLESETKLLALYIKAFKQYLEDSHLKLAGDTMTRANRLALSMIPMLKDVVRYTAFLKASAKNSRGVLKETA